MPIYLGIYEAVLEAMLFQFQCRFIFNRFMTEDEIKPKLVFAHPKNHKLFENGCLAEGPAELDLYVAEITQILSQNNNQHYMSGFFLL